MNSKFLKAFFFLGCFILISCNDKRETKQNIENVSNEIVYATGFNLQHYDNFSVLKVNNPWPNSNQKYTYVLSKNLDKIPDSLSKYLQIQIPIQKAVVTSTTHIPSLVELGVENSLVGFPGLNYISNEVIRKKIDANQIKELDDNENVNLELVIDLQPDLIIGHSYDGENKKLENIKNAGLKIVYNGDWVENTPLGKAEWIKFFGALYDKNYEAKMAFDKIVNSYNDAKKIVENASSKPTVLSGALYQDVWYLPEGESWMAQFIKDAGGNYLWSESKGVGSISLGFETVFDKAQNAQFWIGPGEFTSYEQMQKANPHYAEFSAFKNKNVYSYSVKKGASGGTLFYEEAPNRPDLILKDLIHIFHPNVLPNYKPYFIEPLK
ncbi:ABC transporter substrate-binding protein [Flavobacterium sp. I3-2]|uniref:ABC transporter substrate-binding protein n=1 Tax=Flavobacterium sp. I3-2 TaxID=2748319 RepID=UPI0015AB0AC7|nr:ABC transporter substrate-binding protein [Flavobacterium sp. I3-2]